MSRDEEAQKIIDRIEKAKGDWFKILDVPLETCTVDDLKKAYKKIVIHIHPDKCKLANCKHAFSEADKAYKNLSDTEVLQRFQNAAKKKDDQKKYREKNSSLETWLKKSKENKAGSSMEDLETKMSTELTPEERERLAKMKEQREFYFRHARKQKEKDEKIEKKVRQREEAEREEAELQDTIGSWKNFQQKGKRVRLHMPSLKQDVGATRKTEKSHDETVTKDYLLHRKAWQNYTREM